MSLRNRLIGHADAFSLEARIFHSVCIIIMSALALNIPFNYYIDLPRLALLMFGVLSVVALCYYFSRFHRRLAASITIFQITNMAILVVNYYFNSGSSGPSLLIFILSLVITVAIIPKSQYIIWLPLNTLTVFALLFYERNNPDWIPATYHDSDSRFTDLGYTYVIVAIIIPLVILYIRKAYQVEKEAALLNNKHLQESNNTKNKLLSIMAHDLKDPLASIQGFLELLTECQLDDHQKLSIEKELLSRTQSASQMLSNVLFWTKSQMNGVQVNLRPVRLKDSLSTTMQILHGIAEEKGIDFLNQIDNHVCISADKDMLQLIVRNLCMNAIKFTYPGGTVTVSTEITSDFCTVSVSDTGIGIAADQQPKIFGLAEQSTYGTANEKGAGLGLVLCKNFTEIQGGKLWFSSSETQGTSFYIRFENYHINEKINSLREAHK